MRSAFYFLKTLQDQGTTIKFGNRTYSPFAGENGEGPSKPEPYVTWGMKALVTREDQEDGAIIAKEEEKYREILFSELLKTLKDQHLVVLRTLPDFRSTVDNITGNHWFSLRLRFWSPGYGGLVVTEGCEYPTYQHVRFE